MTSRRVLLAAPFLIAAGRKPLAAVPIHRLDTKWWRERHAAKLAEIKGARPRIVFLGDSITQNWEKAGPPAWQDFQPVWRRHYGHRAAVNLGFSGDATSHLLWRIENGEVVGIEPQVAVILIGANNLGRLRWPPEETVEGIEAVIEATRRRLPRTHIVLIGVLPSVRSDWATAATRSINGQLAQRHGRSADLTYVDLSGLFQRNGATDPGQFYDGLLTPPQDALHPTAQAQERMAAALEPTIARLLGDRPVV